jgi:hypothetical protein
LVVDEDEEKNGMDGPERKPIQSSKKNRGADPVEAAWKVRAPGTKVPGTNKNTGGAIGSDDGTGW